MSDHKDRMRDEALRDTFPASDPPANSGITGTGGLDGRPTKPLGTPPKRPSHKRAIYERPTGTPDSDRHATETAHQWEHHGEEPREHHGEERARRRP
ncbi:MAG TPA: hypothetical protein VHB27_19775 [Rhodopila sp.]|uniref:hypothetical protein n=1 Tax=Rhodopila sp. TaxID=2480087 RepID=UPI002CD875FE|nr:hypothetical protein [Rhodopila sp.]HVY17472.1 hypothetical protein [Rhodopila sp.]